MKPDSSIGGGVSWPVYLIRHELPKDFAAGFRWTLVAVKTAIVPYAGSTYVAFETEEAALEFATTLNSSFHYSVVRHDQLDLNTYISPDSCMLVFESIQQLTARSELGDLSQGRIVKLALSGVFSGLVRWAKNWRAARVSRRIKIAI